jgi:peptidoglycan hydrolase-like protein with peptidoglycan-binding domain
MATSYLRPPDRPRRSGLGTHGRLVYGQRPRRPRGPAALALSALALAILIGALVAYFLTSTGGLGGDSVALARVDMPAGGGRIVRVTVTGPRANLIPVRVAGTRIYPKVKVPAGEHVTVRATVVRPGWLSWLTGARRRYELSLVTPSAHPTARFFTLRRGAALRVSFSQPIRALAYGQPGHLRRVLLAAPAQTVTIPHSAAAGTVAIAGMARSWESAAGLLISWFPAGSGASAVASPQPGTTISPDTPLRLTFSKPVAKVLDGRMPQISPTGAGHWRTLGVHSLEFVPSGYGYGLGAKVTVALPGAVHIVGGSGGSAATVSWSVPDGSTLRLQQLLSMLGYLPFSYSGPAVADDPAAQERAALNPPDGTLSWAYPNIPAELRALWLPGAYGVMTKGAVMAFENNAGLTVDGIAGPAVWKALINAADHHQATNFGYTFVMVSETLPESLALWHNGQIKVTSPVNTGIPAAPTALGVYPVFEHLPVTTMSGVNPNGTPYNDPGIRWVSYFNGGDALHEFPRAAYGFPQSLGCVEMPMANAAAVYPYTPIGTLVDISS